MSTEIEVFARLRAELNLHLQEHYLTLYTILLPYTDQDICTLYLKYQHDEFGRARFTSYDSTKLWINTMISFPYNEKNIPAPQNGWGVSGMFAKMAILSLKNLYRPAPPVQGDEGKIPDYVGQYLTDPLHVEILWEIFEDFQAEVGKLLIKQHGSNSVHKELH